MGLIAEPRLPAICILPDKLKFCKGSMDVFRSHLVGIDHSIPPSSFYSRGSFILVVITKVAKSHGVDVPLNSTSGDLLHVSILSRVGGRYICLSENLQNRLMENCVQLSCVQAAIGDPAVANAIPALHTGAAAFYCVSET